MTTVVRPLHTAVSSPLRIDARPPRTAPRGPVGVALVALLIMTALGVPAAPAYAAGTIAVNTTDDESGAVPNGQLFAARGRSIRQQQHQLRRVHPFRYTAFHDQPGRGHVSVDHRRRER